MNGLLSILTSKSPLYNSLLPFLDFSWDLSNKFCFYLIRSSLSYSYSINENSIYSFPTMTFSGSTGGNL